MTVAIRRIKDNVAEAVSSAMELAGYQKYIPRGATVFLKVNLGWDLFIPGSVTNPAVFEGVVKKLKGYAGKLCVIESDQVLENVQKAYHKSKISEIARNQGVQWINLSKTQQIVKSFPSNRVIQNVVMPEIFSQGILVTLPVMKTHDKTTVTLCLKNQWGCIPKMRHMYHLCLTEAIGDVNFAIRARFAIVDGTIAMEGNAPKTGLPREIGVIGAGGDLVELDSVFARLMGFDPYDIPHIVEAEKRGLGSINLEFIRERLDPISPFVPAGHNFVSLLEFGIMISFLSKFVFGTPIFWATLLGAKIYYWIFEMVKGRALRTKFQKHPLYGKYFGKPRA
jgi:uncharacterized protein (DUF362 family)